jgi:hypothetical protein
MSKELASELEQIVSREAALLSKADENAMGSPRPNRTWTAKQELGHLIDSAANNQQRFMRASIDGSYCGPGYQPDEWVARSGYAEMAWGDVVEFWRRYNLLLSRLVAGIPEARMSAECIVKDGAPVTLRWLIEDYIVHMQYHLDRILNREKITRYPRPAAV